MIIPLHPKSNYIAFILVAILTLSVVCVALDSRLEIAYAQEDSATILNELRNSLQDDRAHLSEIRNMTSTEMAILEEINVTSTKLATQSAYTALSVFFLGIGLVIFGLRITTKSLGEMGKYLNLMIWALTIPVIILVAIFQYGVIANLPAFVVESEDPFLLLSFLMYIPIGIVLFLLFKQRRIFHLQAAKSAGPLENLPINQIEKIFSLKERGAITDEEFQKLKTDLLSKL
jgi:hypothetical protein